MAHQPGGPKAGGSQQARAAALMLIRVAAGVFLFFIGLGKIRWLLDSTPLANQLSGWLAQATPVSRWYLERVMPGIPVFARLVPLAEMIAGLALLLGFWTRLTAGMAFLMVLNIHVASGAMFKYTYLSDGRGLLLLAVLLGLTLGGASLPLSVRK